MIENFQIQEKKGIGWIVFLGLFPIVNFFVMIAAWKRDKQKQLLKKAPYFCITDSINLGNAIFWSLPYFFVSVVLFLAFLTDSSDTMGGFPRFLYFSYILFVFLIACFLVNHRIKYKWYLNQINQLMTLVASKPGTAFSKDFLCSTIKTKVGNLPEENLIHMLKDLDDNFIVRCSQNVDNGMIYIELFPDKDSSGETYPVGNWVCKYCAGENDQEKESCSFCGASKA